VSGPDDESDSAYLERKREHRGPSPCVDVILVRDGRVLLIERRNPPHGWALPGGFIDYGESAEAAAVREVKEEVQLAVELVRQVGTYSDPTRDPRQHTLSVAFEGRLVDPAAEPRAADDAKACAWFPLEDLPELAFDHGRILADFLARAWT